MDEAVLRAMVRWPQVPAVFGWLELDRRGRWLICGETLANRAANEFIARNYARDGRGRWYFQNGPQRVYVRLHYTPWVLRLAADAALSTHTGQPAGAPTAAFMDEHGAVLVHTAVGVGLLDDRDLDAFADALRGPGGAALGASDLERRVDALAGGGGALAVRLGGALLPVGHLPRVSVPGRFGFEPDPRPLEPSEHEQCEPG